MLPTIKKILPLTIAAITLSLTACQSPSVTPTKVTLMQSDTTLQFNPNQYQSIMVQADGQSIMVRAYQNIVYVANPVDKTHQSMNVYVPENYFLGKTVGRFDAHTAPIFMPNAVGGYMPAKPMTVGKGRDGQPNSLAMALVQGYVVASAGARGRTLQDEQGQYIGKAPAAIVDLKAAVRYLKANDKLMAGRADRIIVNGTSAGGAMTALLGATGNQSDYQDELDKVGAAKASDEVFAVSSYAPILNLENADAAYEWQFFGINHYNKMSISMLDYQVKRTLVPSVLTDDEQKLSMQLKDAFPSYVNALNLVGRQGGRLTLNHQGLGSFKDEVLSYLNDSANQAYHQGVDLSAYPFLAQQKSKNPYYIDNYPEFLANYVGRSKAAPAFDGVALDRGENQLFGNQTINHRHFTQFSQANSTVVGATMADALTIKMMNPMAYLNHQHSGIAPHWRIRHGAKDSDTSFAIPVILATRLQNLGKQVDFKMVWNQGHGGDYDLPELFAWIEQTVK